MEVIGKQLRMHRGDDDSLLIGRADGGAFDAEDAGTFSIKSTPGGTDVLEIDMTGFVTYQGVTRGGMVFAIAHADTEAIPLGKYYWDVLVTWADTTVTTLETGVFILEAGGSD
jgi:hypothetical protein